MQNMDNQRISLDNSRLLNFLDLTNSFQDNDIPSSKTRIEDLE